GSHIALLDSGPERARINMADVLLAMNDLLGMNIKGYERERMKPLTSDVLQQRSQHLELSPIKDGSTRIGRGHVQQNLDVERIASAAHARCVVTARLLGKRCHRVRWQAYGQIPFAGGQLCLGSPMRGAIASPCVPHEPVYSIPPWSHSEALVKNSLAL